MTITISDENDLPPKFQFKSYRGEVTENVPIGSSVLTITAVDPDLSNTTKVSPNYLTILLVYAAYIKET